mmetsp:Transcript_11812/g.37900  ORF Transcript_11812/g.37900 Transcript_11812/m.37900 type:complete len:537 (+) Transcript_11812:211-1821(+)
MAQVNASFGSKLTEPIAAVPPSEREQRLWGRLLEAEACVKGSTKGGGGGLLGAGTRLLALAAKLSARLALAAVVVLASSTSQADVPAELRAASEAVGEWFPRLLPRVLLLMFVFSWMLCISLARRSLLLCWALRLASWRHALLALASAVVWGGGAVDGTGGLIPRPFVADALQDKPVWATFCIALSVVVLFMSWRLARLVAIYLVSVVPIFVYWGCGRAQRMFNLSDATAQELFYDNADALMAPYMTNSFLVLGGLFVKLGQWLSNMSFGVPIKLQESLKKLQDTATIDGEAHIRALILSEFGGKVEDLFEDFAMVPIASASIAQVHAATLRDKSGRSRKVAVKLQHQSVEQLILLDLGALKRIVSICCWLGGDKWNDTKRLLDSWARDMVLELDFQHEVQNLREVREGLIAGGLDVVVPKEVDGWVSRRAFVMEFCEGFRFTDLDRLVLHGVDRKAMAARALHATACQLFEIGVFNSDPHAGNLLCQVNETSALPVLLDFGNCIRLSEAQRLAYCRLLVGLSELSITKTRSSRTS